MSNSKTNGNTEAKTTGTDNMTQLPDTTKIYWDDSTQNNGNAENYVGYFFQEISGFSKDLVTDESPAR